MKLLDQIIRGALSRNQQGIGGVARVTPAATSIAAVTPSDTTTYVNMLYLYATGAGNLVLEMPDGTTATFAVLANTRWDVSAVKVKAATTATGVIAFLAGN